MVSPVVTSRTSMTAVFDDPMETFHRYSPARGATSNLETKYVLVVSIFERRHIESDVTGSDEPRFPGTVTPENSWLRKSTFIGRGDLPLNSHTLSFA
jgi:hypothetical protein